MLPAGPWRDLAASLLMLIVGLAVVAVLGLPSRAAAADEFLDPMVAFKVSMRAADPRTVEVVFDVAPGYYLYQEQFKVAAAGATLGTPVYPKGKVKFDETFQKEVETHRDRVAVAVPVAQAGGPFVFGITYQGCADKGLCYPPMQARAKVSLAGFGGDGQVTLLEGREPGPLSNSPLATAIATPAPATAAPPRSAQGGRFDDSAGIDAVLRSGRFWSVLGVFFAAGLLLSFTPCVLPMLPILSSIIVGHGEQVSRKRGLAMAASYSLGMALVYTVFGVAAGLAGEGLAAALQTPIVLGAFGVLLVLLSLSMFGVYELQLPSALTGRLDAASQRMRGGHAAGVFAMGGLSALIVSPCVAAPLAGALVYLSQTRDVLLGGSALFALAAGMSVPLLLLGASAGTLLPRAGAWMEDVKRLFGLMLLGVAVWTVSPVLPASLVLGLWGALLIATAVVLFSVHHLAHHNAAPRRLLRRSLGAVAAVLGLLQMVGAASGGTDPLQPLSHLTVARAGVPTASALPFRTIATVDELDAVLKSSGKPVMLDFYADWCVSCKEMERFTFSDERVRGKLSQAVLLKADVTKNTDADRALLKRFALFGPPGTIFFDAQGREVSGTRVIGYQDSARFLQTLDAAGL